MKILIADDERLLRINLEAMLEELYPGMHQLAQARDGEELLRMVERDTYDLIFLDINMPKKNGLEALELCQQKTPDTKWCILTGYAEFSYARKAISLGVKGYLLKPVDPEELFLLVEEIRKERVKTLRQKNLLFENQVSQAFALADTTGVVKQMEPVEGRAPYWMYLFFLDTDENQKRQELYARFYERLLEYLQEQIESEDRYGLFFLLSGELCLIVHGREYLRLRSWLRLHAELAEGTARMAAIWSVADSLEELYLNKQITLALSPIRILEENCKPLSLQELNEEPDLMEKQFLCEKLEMLTAAYKTGNYGLAGELLVEMEREESLARSFAHVDSTQLLAYLSVIWKSRFSAVDYGALIRKLRELLQQASAAEHSGRQDVIHQIKEYVFANYMNDVTIAEMGNRFDISPSYISRIFREKTGQKYIDFVTEVRMKKAMELFLNYPGLSVKEAAERVGYISEKHFSKTFKKYFDCLPSQVRV